MNEVDSILRKRAAPISLSTTQRLGAYRAVRDRILGNGVQPFFLNERGRRPSSNYVEAVFAQVGMAIGLRDGCPSGKRGHGPRIHDLPLELPNASILLLRSCSVNGPDTHGWEADALPLDASVDEALKRDLLGARRKIIFVEGTECSLDKPLYSIIFPMASIIPKANCADVERAVLGARASQVLHWLQPFGIVDGDGLDAEQVAVKRTHGVYALSYYSVEAIYFHLRIIGAIAARQAAVSGVDSLQLSRSAITAGITAVANHTGRLSKKATKKAARQAIMEQIPNDDDIFAGRNIQILNKAETIHAARKRKLDAAVANHDWEAILKACPVRESGALEGISSALGFRKRRDYQRAVRHLLSEDKDMLEFVQELFEGLVSEVLA